MLLKRTVQRYGWRPDTPDQRDLIFRHATARRTPRLPSKVDLRPGMPPVYDQGQLGSCTANAIGAAYEYQQKMQGLEDYTPSRLFIYYGEREIEGTIGSDAGAEIRDGMKVVANLGAPHESLWPYNLGQFTTRPAQFAYDDAVKHNCLKYESVAVSSVAVKTALAVGFPVVIGFTVYDSFESDAVARTGIVPVPKKSESVLGGHAVLIVGYQLIKRTLYAIVRNSWGQGWGDAGCCYMRMSWLTDSQNAGDFWTLRITEG